MLLAADSAQRADRAPGRGELSDRGGLACPRYDEPWLHIVGGWLAEHAGGCSSRGSCSSTGSSALEDTARSGRLPLIDEIDVVVATIAEDGRTPANLGVTHWSARLLAAELKISCASVARIWRNWDLQLPLTG